MGTLMKGEYLKPCHGVLSNIPWQSLKDYFIGVIVKPQL